MTKTLLGTLEKVDLREAWASEASDFTPWLAEEENISLLGDTIGLDLEVEVQEKGVGPFRADILCKDTATDHWVLIENQLERTDHTHLGQLLTYAAGLQAVTIVWIAQRFTDEHRATLDWLNDVTDEGIAFFGLEVELWRIGDSPVAPKFNVVSSPNEWIKGSTGRQPPSELSPSKSLQLEFWKSFRDYVEEHGACFRTRKPLPQNWMTIPIGRSGIHLTAIASLWDSVSESYDKHELRAQLEMSDGNAKVYYGQLLAMKEEVEGELRESLVWYNPDNKRACRIYLQTTVDLHDRAAWNQYHEWLCSKLEGLYKVFQPRVRLLDATTASDVCGDQL